MTIKTPVLKLGIRIPGAEAFPLTQSALSPLIDTIPPLAEGEAAGHWLLGSDYDAGSSFPDLISGQALTLHGAATINAHNVSLGVGANWLSSPIDDAAEQTLCAVVQQQPAPTSNGNGALIMGLWDGAAGAALFDLNTGSAGLFIYAGGIAVNTLLPLPAATANWIFLAMSFAPQKGPVAAAATIFTSGAHTTVLQGAKTAAVAGSKVGLGDSSGFTSQTGPLVAAEFVVFNKSLTLAQMQAVYARSIARMATRSITVV